MQYTVLVVEDDAAVRESLVRALGQDGYAVETAADGHAALASVNAKEPDVVVLDVGLPGVDGLAVCRRRDSDLPSACRRLIASAHLPTVKAGHTTRQAPDGGPR